ncbi:MAG: hypothetical protein KC620_13300 [Myxococcales bacterium]|nr:hypothetical protein [Myxococcales bacterium]
MRLTICSIALLLVAAGGVLSGCENTFGEPCTLPTSEEFRRACDPAASEEESDDENRVRMDSKASCAVKNFAGCETRICLVYRGSDSYCSERCEADEDCQGSAVCRPLIGDKDLEPDICTPSGNFIPECYCVKSGDAAR